MTWSTTTTFSWWAQRKSFTSAPTRSGCRRTWIEIEKCWIILWKCFPHTKFKHRYFAISQIAAGYFFLFILDVWIREKIPLLNLYLKYLDVFPSSGHESSFGVETVQTESKLELLVQQNEDSNTLRLEKSWSRSMKFYWVLGLML